VAPEGPLKFPPRDPLNPAVGGPKKIWGIYQKKEGENLPQGATQKKGDNNPKPHPQKKGKTLLKPFWKG